MVYCLVWYHEIHDSVKSFGKFRASVFLFLPSITFASVIHSSYYLGISQTGKYLLDLFHTINFIMKLFSEV